MSDNETRRYTRWTRQGSNLFADILTDRYVLAVDPDTGDVSLRLPRACDGAMSMTPDSARLLGVRLIEGAALADGERAIRE